MYLLDNMVDVISIDDSDDESNLVVSQPHPIKQPSFIATASAGCLNSASNPNAPDKKPQVISSSNLAPNNTAEDVQASRSKKIDQLLDVYIKYHNRLESVEYMMTPEQLTRWHSHLATSYGPTASIHLQQMQEQRRQQQEQSQNDPNTSRQGTESPNEPQPGSSSTTGWQRPPWFIDPPNSGPSTSRSTYKRTAASRTTARAPVRRKYKRRRKVRASSSRTTARRAPAKKKATASTVRTSSTSAGTKSKTTGTSTATKRKTSTVVDRKPKVTKLQALLAKVKKER